MYFYVDTKEMLKEPKYGKQYEAWYVRGSTNFPNGYPHIDVINGEECSIRALDENKLVMFLKSAYTRAPYIKAVKITVEEDD